MAVALLCVGLGLYFSFFAVAVAGVLPPQDVSGTAGDTAALLADRATAGGLEVKVASSSISDGALLEPDLSDVASSESISRYEVYAHLAGFLPSPWASAEHAAQEAPLLASNDRTDAATLEKVKRHSDLKIMIVGDSMSQGRQGDWTWRYRIWEWFRSQNLSVNFVGPYNGTYMRSDAVASPPKPPPLHAVPPTPEQIVTHGTYAAGTSLDFDSEHFAVWGRAAAVDKDLIHDVVAKFKPDLMLLMLGVNDLGWGYSNVSGLMINMKELIGHARAAQPGIKIAMANIANRTFIKGREKFFAGINQYNAYLVDAIPQWSTAESPIYEVPLRETYTCGPTICPATYDGLHPNELGEYQIARAFSQTLVEDFKIGKSPLEVPDNDDIPVRPLPIPSKFKLTSSPTGVTAIWAPVYGAHGYELQVSINGLPEKNTTKVSANRWDTDWTEEGWVYEVQVRAQAGNRYSDWTSPKKATSRPQTAPGPRNVTTRPLADGFEVSWEPPKGPHTDSIIEYNVLYLDCDNADGDHFSQAAFEKSPATIHDLEPGHHYLVAIVTWNKYGGGFPEIVGTVTVGASKPVRSKHLSEHGRRQDYLEQVSRCDRVSLVDPWGEERR